MGRAVVLEAAVVEGGDAATQAHRLADRVGGRGTKGELDLRAEAGADRDGVAMRIRR
jgi:hypothetical protein